MNKVNNNLQDVFLNQARKGHIPVSIHLANGFQIKGYVKGFDNFTIILDSEGKQLLIYKHAVSTISPQKPVLFNTSESESEDVPEEEKTTEE
ncbi:MAG: RNA chaperone Hfq [Clostridiales bacterium]|nr:RNA chaperone Hfq [Clostridiales bacterium]